MGLFSFGNYFINTENKCIVVKESARVKRYGQNVHFKECVSYFISKFA